MKKIVFLFLSVFLSSCACVLSQVPPQTIYVDASCQGRIPDYTKIITANDNCGIVTLTQVPAAGFLLTVDNPVQDVVVTGTDRFGNKSQPLHISVTLIDTIKPILHWPQGQANMGEKGLLDLYANWEAAVKVYGIAQWMYDQHWTQGLAFADSTKINNELHYFTNVIKLSDDEYAQYVNFKTKAK
jgi:hypothetical protein